MTNDRVVDQQSSFLLLFPSIRLASPLSICAPVPHHGIESASEVAKIDKGANNSLNEEFPPWTGTNNNAKSY
jgi:hypothetical protein